MLVSNAGFTTEVFTDGRDAIIVPPRDPLALADAVVRLLTDPSAREELVEGCRALHARHGHSPEAIVERHVAIYHKARGSAQST